MPTPDQQAPKPLDEQFRTPTPAELRLVQMEDAFSQLPQKEQEEIKYVRERMDFLRVKFGSSADLVIAYLAILISKERGQ